MLGRLADGIEALDRGGQPDGDIKAVDAPEEPGYLAMDDAKLRLTSAGRSVAEKVYERHRFLTAVPIRLGVDPRTARIVIISLPPFT